MTDAEFQIMTIIDTALPQECCHGLLLAAQERHRVVTQEGFTPENDDEHGMRTLLAAGVCYAQKALADLDNVELDEPPYEWPFHASDWKPADGDTLKDLRRALQLICAAVDVAMRED